MKDGEKSGLQTSLGDVVSLFSLCCAFGVPELFFLVFVGSPAPPHQLSAHMDALHHTHAQHHKRCTLSNPYIAILSKET